MERRPRPATVVLIGPMGAGKTEVGQRLALLLGRQFHDTDRMVEHSSGKTVPEIFAGEGEAAFRALEAEAVREAAQSSGAVIACGGGAVMDAGNVEALKANGVIVYLKPSLEVALTRVGSGEGRPLLQGGSPSSNLATLLASRDPVYERAADITVDADGGVPEVAERVLAALAQAPRVAPRSGRVDARSE